MTRKKNKVFGETTKPVGWNYGKARYVILIAIANLWMELQNIVSVMIAQHLPKTATSKWHKVNSTAQLFAQCLSCSTKMSNSIAEQEILKANRKILLFLTTCQYILINDDDENDNSYGDCDCDDTYQMTFATSKGKIRNHFYSFYYHNHFVFWLFSRYIEYKWEILWREQLKVIKFYCLCFFLLFLILPFKSLMERGQKIRCTFIHLSCWMIFELNRCVSAPTHTHYLPHLRYVIRQYVVKNK